MEFFEITVKESLKAQASYISLGTGCNNVGGNGPYCKSRAKLTTQSKLSIK